VSIGKVVADDAHGSERRANCIDARGAFGLELDQLRAVLADRVDYEEVDVGDGESRFSRPLCAARLREILEQVQGLPAARKQTLAW